MISEGDCQTDVAPKPNMNLANLHRKQVRPLSRKEKLILFLLVGLTAFVAMLGRIFAAQVEPIFADMRIVLPHCTNLVFDTAPYWPLLSVVLLPLFFWSLRPSSPPQQPHRMWWVVVLDCLASIALMLAGALCLVHSISQIDNGLQGM